MQQIWTSIALRKNLKRGRKHAKGLPFFVLDSIHKVFSNDNYALKKELNLDFSPEISPEKLRGFHLLSCTWINKFHSTAGGSESTLHE